MAVAISKLLTFTTILILGLITGLSIPYHDFDPDQWLEVKIRMDIDPRWGMIGSETDIIFRQPVVATFETAMQKKELDDLMQLFGDGKYSGEHPIMMTITTDDDILEYAFAKFQHLGITYDGDGNIVITQKPF